MRWAQIGLPNKARQTGWGNGKSGAGPLQRTKRVAAPKNGHSSVGKLFLDCLFLQEAPCHAKRAKGSAEQHDGGPAIRSGGCNCPKHQSCTELRDC